MKRILVTPPLRYPLTLAEAKAHLNIDDGITADDALIQGFIAAATDDAESILNRRLITQTWRVFLDDWPGGDFIELPFGALQSVSSVKYKDSAGTEYTMDTGDYIVDADSDPGRVVLAYGASWPSVTLYPSNPIYIEFVCGYGDHEPKSVEDASVESPIVLTVTGHGYTTGDQVAAADIAGNTAANGVWIIEKVDADDFKLLGSDGNAEYTEGGTVRRIDVPDPILSAIKILIADLYENREETIIGTISSNLDTVKNILFKYILWA